MKAKSRRLKFIEKFDEASPDAFHRIYFDLSRKYFGEKKRILNIGCWTGSYERLFEGENCEVISIDIEEKALLVAKQANPYVSFASGNILNLPFKNDTFDAVTLYTVLEHLPQNSEEESFAEIKRVLINGGNLIITTPSDQWFGNIMDIAYWTVGHRHYKLDALKNMLKGVGFKIREAQLKGKFLSNLSIPFFYGFKYFFKMDIYRNSLVQKFLKSEYQSPGYRDIYLVATK